MPAPIPNVQGKPTHHSPKSNDSGRKAHQRINSSTSSTSLSLPPSNLQRLHPDSILADEADPDTLLGAETDSEVGEPTERGRSQAPTEGSEPQVTMQGGRPKTSPSEALRSDDAAAAAINAKDTVMIPTTTSTADTATTPIASGTRMPWALLSAEDPATELAKLRLQIEDLTNQVTGLNGKLVNSFMRISDLEDDLSDARERVMTGSTRVAELEKERQEHLAALNTGLLVEKAHVSTEMQRMMDRVIEETKQRGQAESDKAKIEAELDELSANLFNEANRMVAVEKLARARAEEKSKSMEERLQDTEGIMLEQQKVLGDLQQKLDKVNAPVVVTAPRGPNLEATATHGMVALSASASSSQNVAAANQLQVVSSLHTSRPEPEVMLDIVPYQELRSFLDHLRKLRKQLAPFFTYPYDPTKPNASHRHANSSGVSNSSANSSTASSSPGSQNLAMAGPYASYSSHAATGPQGIQHTSPFVLAGLSRHKDYPTLPSNCESLVHIPSQLSLPFIKRAQEEDSDPCLRLDFAPGLNWLTRRTANTAILEGNLVIEPIFPGGKAFDEGAIRARYAKLPLAACAMCGISLLNVPVSGAEEPSRNSTPDRRTMTNWAQSMAAATGSAAYSLREAAANAGASNSSSLSTINPRARESLETKPSLKSSRSGLFGSFGSLRSKTVSPKPSQGVLTLTPETILDAESTPANAAHGNANNAQVPGNPASLGLEPLSVPTHIFRLSETSNTRYLLCPHYCLIRLRAACAFWGYLRSIERAVVLEGKLAWDDVPPMTAEKTASTSAEVPAAAVTYSEPSAPVNEATQTLSIAVADHENLALEKKSVANFNEGSSEAITDDDDDSEDEAGFQDAPSANDSPMVEVKDGETVADQVDKIKQKVGADKKPAPLDIAAANAGLKSTKATTNTLASTSPTMPTTVDVPPAVPPQWAKRSFPAVSSRPPLPSQASGAPAAAASLGRTSAHNPLLPVVPIRRSMSLASSRETELAWEEKVYQEVIRLKRNMWEARAGFEHRKPVFPTHAATEQEGKRDEAAGEVEAITNAMMGDAETPVVSVDGATEAASPPIVSENAATAENADASEGEAERKSEKAAAGEGDAADSPGSAAPAEPKQEPSRVTGVAVQ